MNDKLLYEDIQLGEKALKAYKEDMSPIEIVRTFPTYLNTHEIYAGLNTTDLIIANILAGNNGFIMGATSSGKSQCLEDIANTIFGGKIKSGGGALIVEVERDFEF